MKIAAWFYTWILLSVWATVTEPSFFIMFLVDFSVGCLLAYITLF